MATFFHRTDVINGHQVAEGKVYTVFIDGAFWGWVAGEDRNYHAMPENAYQWASGRARRTKAQALQAALANIAAEKVRREHRATQVPTEVRVVRLTAENVATEGPQLTGWLVDGAEDLGPMEVVRLTRDGYDNAKLVGDRGSDVLGLPSTITAYRL